MINICDDLKSKAGGITEKINHIRLKVNLQNIDIPAIELEGPDLKEIDNQLIDMKKQLEDTKEGNKKIQLEVYKRTKDFINQSRLDILFIIDCTNSINTYLADIKSNFTKMIDDIKKSCPTCTIYAGFIGYLDFLDLDLGENYVNIEFTKEIQTISDQIKDIESHGGGDVAEDLAGAFEMALKKDWQGISRFAIIATDAPCHGAEFHGKEKQKNFDNYPEGDRENRNIKDYVKNFAENKISLFCAKYSEDTDLMFDIFKGIYNGNKNEGDQNEFNYEKCENICESIIRKAEYIYQVNRKEVADIK